MNDCLFCKIVRGEIPTDKVYESEFCIVIRDINPVAPIHDLIILKKHIVMLEDISTNDKNMLADIFFTAKKVVEMEGIDKSGYRLISNYGKDGGPLVKHVHFHILGGKNLGPKIVCV
jgi:histidine triad (HIT) family protein